MCEITATNIVNKVLAYDIDPPNVDYNPYDHGVEVASQIPTNIGGDIVRKCFEELPGTTAVSFLEGFLAVANIQSLDVLLLDCLPNTRDVGAGSAIVTLLRDVCGLTPTEIGDQVMDRLTDTVCGGAQDRVCFALWALICGECYDVKSGEVRRNPITFSGSRISNLVESLVLTHYAKTTLEECMKCLANRR